ncbi:hypothetical protein COU57_02315 [Candidatus Pacearchaeota archaeon CG10_big_fil_rev_8_21_14_0_10_32_14]|nr:MAG: hypothetical protein COU57_02315 [Candidatus Pacearchaeota archaeon CG10_big_fil_rev_8_21_14_0_10_32_14]
MAGIGLFSNKIEIKFSGTNLKLNKNEIESIEKYQRSLGFLSKWIKINHVKKRIPPFIVIWSLSRDKIFDDLNQLGYNIK